MKNSKTLGVAFALACGGLICTTSQTKAVTLGELTQECTQLETFWQTRPPTRNSSPVPHQADPAICFGYIQAFIDLTGLVGGTPEDPDIQKCFVNIEGELGGGPKCRPALGFCFPKGAGYSQVLAVFLAYARSHTAQWHEPAWSHFATSMIRAFPCKDPH